MFDTLWSMGIDSAQRRVLNALLEHHPEMVPADELRVELADVHDIDQALTALIKRARRHAAWRACRRELGRGSDASVARKLRRGTPG